MAAAMSSGEEFADWPRRVSGPGGLVYSMMDGHYAVQSRPGSVEFRKGRPAEQGARVTPVYAAENGAPAAPTGDVFVRFVEGQKAEARRADLERAGYEVVKIPAYAPHAAWARARTGGAPWALRHLSDLHDLPGVEAVEPQLLMESTPRGP